ncbi:hypothetical protein LJK88_24100 [Paenibacillus sp. P26]|nr:hypothetical protein LJK88_24100 [Paenibacillus sp. P26]
MEFVQTESFKKQLLRVPGLKRGIAGFFGPILARAVRNVFFSDPHQAHQTVNQYLEACVQKAQSRLAGVSGPERIRRIQELTGGLLRSMFRDLMPYPMAGILSSRSIRILSRRWLGDGDVIHVLNKSLPGNVTSEMGLLIGDLADAARPYPGVAQLIRHARPHAFRESLRGVEGETSSVRRGTASWLFTG